MWLSFVDIEVIHTLTYRRDCPAHCFRHCHNFTENYTIVYLRQLYYAEGLSLPLRTALPEVLLVESSEKLASDDSTSMMPC